MLENKHQKGLNLAIAQSGLKREQVEAIISTYLTAPPGDPIERLDHGFVRLVDSMGSDLSVVRAARVSYDAAWRSGENTGSDKRLIHRLWEDGHTSPFEAVTFTFEVKAPIFVLRQWHRHRTWSFNELSARYKELPEAFYLPDPDKIGFQSKSNKQGREENTNPEVIYRRTEQIKHLQKFCEAAFQQYKVFLEDGWPREIARSILPAGTYSHMFATVDLLNLFKFLTLRLHPHAQYEIRIYAEAMLELIRPIVPTCVAAWEKENQYN